MKNVGIVLLCILLIGALAVPAMAGEGCSQGFWRHHTDVWQGYAPEDLVVDIFVDPNSYVDVTDTLLQALRYRGGRGPEGGARILLRQAVAAVLNAAHSGVTYPQTESDVIATVNGALAGGDRDTMLNLAKQLDDDNNLDCPLDE